MQRINQKGRLEGGIGGATSSSLLLLSSSKTIKWINGRPCGNNLFAGERVFSGLDNQFEAAQER